MEKNRYKRFLDIIEAYDCEQEIHIIGCGGIGSWTAMVLAKMGFRFIFLYDNDKVEDHNVATQLFSEQDIGKEKSLALGECIHNFSGINPYVCKNKDEKEIKSGIVIIAVDSMKERIKLGNMFKDKNVMIIDGRMGGLQMEVYTSEAKDYLSTTCDPESIERDVCTAKSICFNCMACASFIADAVREYIKNDIKKSSVTMSFNDKMTLVS